MEEIMAEKENKTIIFVETKKRCDDLTRRMRRDGWVHVAALNTLVHDHIHPVADPDVCENGKECISF